MRNTEISKVQRKLSALLPFFIVCYVNPVGEASATAQPAKPAQAQGGQRAQNMPAAGQKAGPKSPAAGSSANKPAAGQKAGQNAAPKQNSPNSAINQLATKRNNVQQLLREMRALENGTDLFAGWEKFCLLRSGLASLARYFLKEKLGLAVSDVEIFSKIEVAIAALVDFKGEDGKCEYPGLFSMYKWGNFNALMNKAALSGNVCMVGFLFALGVPLSQATVDRLEAEIESIENQDASDDDLAWLDDAKQIVACNGELQRAGWFTKPAGQGPKANGDVGSQSGGDVDSQDEDSGDLQNEGDRDLQDGDDSDMAPRNRNSHNAGRGLGEGNNSGWASPRGRNDNVTDSRGGNRVSSSRNGDDRMADSRNGGDRGNSSRNGDNSAGSSHSSSNRGSSLRNGDERGNSSRNASGRVENNTRGGGTAREGGSSGASNRGTDNSRGDTSRDGSSRGGDNRGGAAREGGSSGTNSREEGDRGGSRRTNNNGGLTGNRGNQSTNSGGRNVKRIVLGQGETLEVVAG